MNHVIPSRTLFVAVLSAMLAAGLVSTAPAGIIQQVTVGYGGASQTPLDLTEGVRTVLFSGNFDDFANQFVVGATSADITGSILASISGSTGGGPYGAVASAGEFGSLGLSTRLGQETGANFVAAQVLIASDEFVNLTGVTQNVSASFIVDGGTLSVSGREAVSEYRLVVGGSNLGTQPANTARPPAPNSDAVDEFDHAFFSGGTLRRDASQNVTYTVLSDPLADVNSDLGAMLQPNTLREGIVDIPLSLQGLDLGTLLPGERMLVFYQVTFQTSLLDNGGGTTGFSDPLNLSLHSNFPTITMTPAAAAVPEPSSLALCALGALGLSAAARRRIGKRQEPAGVI